MIDENKKPIIKKEKKLLCPFNPDPEFTCEDCRLYVSYPYGKGEKTCVFIRMV